MIASKYLKQTVDFDKPILAVGPGLECFYSSDGKNPIGIPMDAATIWFAQKLHGKKGRLDIFDLPTESDSGGIHHIEEVMNYFSWLSQRIPLGEINYITGDVTTFNLPPSYGFIWDHGTLVDWISEDMPSPLNQWRKKGKNEMVFENYTGALLNGGIAAICMAEYMLKEFIDLTPTQVNSKIILMEDKYQTNFTATQLFPPDELAQKELSEDNCLEPFYPQDMILELRKS
jgi:hypothetical protein